MELIDRARKHHAAWNAIHRALSVAIDVATDCADTAEALAPLQAMREQAASCERHYAHLIQQIDDGNVAHVDDVRWAVTERGGRFMRHYAHRAACALCGDNHMMVEQYCLPNDTLTYVWACTSCGLAYEDIGV